MGTRIVAAAFVRAVKTRGHDAPRASHRMITSGIGLIDSRFRLRNMPISTELLQRVLNDALHEFFQREGAGLAGGVNERNSCGRLAIYLEQAAKKSGLTGYYADPEYNRKQGGQVKTILDKRMRVITINADLLLHSRGEKIAEDNLIAIEMKKSGRPEAEKNSDRNRLRAMTKSSFDDIWSNDGKTHPEHVCGYRLGVFIEVDSVKRIANLEYFRDGKRIGSESRQQRF